MQLHASQFLKSIKDLNQNELQAIKGLGQVLAQNILDFASSQRIDSLISRLEDLENKNKGLNILSKAKTNIDGILSGERICITGSFQLSRTSIKESLESLGATVIDSVNNQTTMLVCGQAPGSKLIKAEKLGIKIIHQLNQIPGLSLIIE